MIGPTKLESVAMEHIPLSRLGGTLMNPKVLLISIAVAVTSGLLIQSQAFGFTCDEGFHLLTAQLIMSGKRPYLDFCFPPTPLNAYWNAAWMRMFGDTWRTAHAVAALLTIGSMLLSTDYSYRRFPIPGWRVSAAITTIFLVGLNAMVFDFATLGQA
jgi:hypothetical protein